MVREDDGLVRAKLAGTGGKTLVLLTLSIVVEAVGITVGCTVCCVVVGAAGITVGCTVCCVVVEAAGITVCCEYASNSACNCRRVRTRALLV